MLRLFSRAGALAFAGFWLVLASYAQSPAGTALIRHAPTLNGDVEGSIQQMMAENTTLNGNASVTGDLFVPGTPAVQLNGNPAYGGTLAGTGSATPSNHKVTLNGGASLGHVVRRTDGVALPVVAAPPQPAGTRSVSLNNSSQSPGDFATLKNLTLNGNAGAITVPAGTYGDFTANGNSRFTLGVAGATSPVVYNFQHLTLNGSSRLDVVGPVIITLANSVSANGNIGASANPAWLTLRIANGGLTLNGSVSVHGYVTAPAGTVTLNGSSQLVGGLVADRLTINGNGLLRLEVPAAINQPPSVTLTAPANGSSFPAPAGFTLAAAAADSDGTVAKVEFYQGATKLGEDTSAPYAHAVSGLPAGSYSFTARATDNLGATASSAAVGITVDAPVNQPPAVTLTAPLNGASFNAPGAFLLAAAASDPDGTVAKVEFYRDGTKLGEDALAPFEFTVSALAAGTYHFLAQATDNAGLATDSASITVTVVAPNVPPTVALTAPAEGASFTAPATISLAADASDSDGTVARVEFFNGDAKLGEDIAAPYEFIWTPVASGTYVLTAKATDNGGTTTISDAVSVTVADNGVPFLANFEPAEGYQPGPLNGQKSWNVDGSANIVTSPVYAGQQAVSVAPATPPALIVRTFVNVDPSVTFVDLFVQPAAGATPLEGVFLETDALRVALTVTSLTGILQAFNGDGEGGGTWFPTGEGPALDPSGRTTDWLRLTARADYSSKQWDLYFNGQMIAADLGFIDNTSTAFTGLGLSGHPTLATGFDDLLVAFDNPLFADADHDGMDDAWETAHGLNPALNDRNGDFDQDGVTNLQEYILGTNPNNADTDSDSLPDGWEQQHGLDPNLDDSNEDSDHDGLTNIQEYQRGTDANNADTDGDGLSDTLEVVLGYDPLVAQPGVSFDSDEDGDGLTLAQELELGTDPRITTELSGADTDGDGLSDKWETAHGLNPLVGEEVAVLNADADGDGLTLAQEVQAGTNPASPDTDGDGMRDDYEIKHSFNPRADDRALDADGDGLDNLEEYRRGTDPTDYYNGAEPEILPFIGGDFDLGAGNVLAVRVTDKVGTPLVNAPVVFEMNEGESLIALTPDGPTVGRSAEVRTGPGGIARVFIRTP